MPLVDFEDQETDASGEVPFRMDATAPESAASGPRSSVLWGRAARIGVALTFAAAIAVPVWLAFSTRNQAIDSSMDGQAQAPLAPAGPDRSKATGQKVDEEIDADRSTGQAPDDGQTAETAPDGQEADAEPGEPDRSSGGVTSTTRPEPTRRTTTTVRRTTSTSSTTSTSTTARPSSTTRPPSTTRPSSTTVASTTPAAPSSTEPPTTVTTVPPTLPSTAASTIAPTPPPTTAPTTAPTTVPIPAGNLVSGGGFERPRVATGDWAMLIDPDWQSSGGGVEIWGTGHSGVDSYRGRQHIELNGNGPNTISQFVPVVPNLTYQWSLVHRGRQDTDTIEVLIDGRSVGQFATAPGSWRRLEGLVNVPAGQQQLLLQLRALDGGSSGNLVDDVRLVAIG